MKAVYKCLQRTEENVNAASKYDKAVEILQCIRIYTPDFKLFGHKIKREFNVILNCNEDLIRINLIEN